MKKIKSVFKKSILFLCVLMLSMFLFNCFVSKDMFYSSTEVTEKRVVAKVLNIISNQVTTFESKKRYATAKELEIEQHQIKGYKIEMLSDEKSFRIWAVPVEYGKTGKTSFYADSDDGDVRGADHQGEKATSKDPVIQRILDETRNILRTNRELNKQ